MVSHICLFNTLLYISYPLQGTTFYENLVRELQKRYGFCLDDYTSSPSSVERPRRSVKLALLSVQKALICLGDIARYKEIVNGTTAYGKARRYDGWK